MSVRIERAFPRLRSADYSITSPSTRLYNCVAWAAGVSDAWWWPDPLGGSYWPQEIPCECTLAAFIALYEHRGYEPCSSPQAERGFDRIALFVSAEGVPTHAARQLEDGLWTSKLGEGDDITHLLNDLEGDIYGSVAQIMKRARPFAGETG